MKPSIETKKQVKQAEIKASISEILITENDSLIPYVHIFRHEPENIALLRLGSIFGFFEIEDHSDDSAYIVNFLASVVKKEYFSNPKRPPLESLEATLFKVNKALTEIIKQGNNNWLGKLNACICAFESNNLHFSVAGKASVLLIRNEVLTDIGEGLAEESAIHPMKTFAEVSSGRMKESDKIVLATPGLFDVFTAEELLRNAVKLPKERFIRFVRTALINQLTFGVALLADMEEKTTQKKAEKAFLLNHEDTSRKRKETEPIPNAFSQSSFEKENSKKPEKSIDTTDSETSQQEELSSNPTTPEYIDSKTGHIYVQGDTPNTESNEFWEHTRWSIEKNASVCTEVVQKYYTRFFKVAKNQSSSSAKTIVVSAQKGSHLVATGYQTIQPIIAKLVSKENRQKAAHIAWRAFESSRLFIENLADKSPKLREYLEKLSEKQRRLAFLGIIVAVLLLLITPFFFLTSDSQEQAKAAPTPQPIVETPKPVEKPLSKDKSVRFIQPETLFPSNSIRNIFALNDTIIAITERSIINLSNPNQPIVSEMPSEFGNSIKLSAGMSDISTAFLLTDSGKLISFTPSDRKFSQNTITLPSTNNISSIASYLTYIYIVDAASDTLLRFPRVEGGFGDATSWFKEPVAIDPSDTINIGERVYLNRANSLSVFEKGKKVALAIENSTTPISFTASAIPQDKEEIISLDSVNGRVIRFNKSSGSIIAQYANESLKKATSLVFDGKNNRTLVATPSGIVAIKME